MTHLKKRIKLSTFSIDRNLGFLLHKTTGDSRDQIMSYFHDIAVSTVVDATESTTGLTKIDKNICLLYKDTFIPFKMNVYGMSWNSSDMKVRANVYFYSSKETYSWNEVEADVAESSLGLKDSFPEEGFPAPKLRAPRFLKEVRKKSALNILGKPKEVDNV